MNHYTIESATNEQHLNDKFCTGRDRDIERASMAIGHVANVSALFRLSFSKITLNNMIYGRDFIEFLTRKLDTFKQLKVSAFDQWIGGAASSI